MASGSSVQIARGYYQFKVEYSKTKEIGIGKFVTIPPFHAGGHIWLIEYYPQGHAANKNGTYISLSLKHQAPITSVTADYELAILNKYGQSTSKSWIKSTKTFHGEDSWRYSKFMKRSNLESDYIRDDYFIVVCSITVIFEPCAILKNCSIGIVHSNLAEELGALLERQEETDVTFKVEGENIFAHRLILASRSPVFKTELFGQMVERNCECIEIDDMKALVFKAMLHFMYTDSVPDMDDLVSGGNLYQHLLVAADRYALEGLKKLCEGKLCRMILIDTVVSSLVVAEQHNCGYLKNKCLDFIARPENFAPVALSKEYATLANSFPSLLDELRKKVYCVADHK